MLHPIFPMAAVTTVVAVTVFGTMLRQICPRDARRRWVLVLSMLGCCMTPLAYYGVRRPLLIRPLEPIFAQPGWAAGGWSVARDLIRLAYAPLTEEPAKLAPWLALLAAGAPLWPARKMLAPVALAAGLGFAIGEMWLVAGLVAEANDPKLARLPWYAFGGFLGERLLTCIAHSLFALPTIALARRRWQLGFAGLALGMLLHALANAPILLMNRSVFGWKTEVWSVLVQLWVIAFFIAGLVALIVATYGGTMLRKIFARQMICPGCGAAYRQPIFWGLNFGMSRYERCSVCYKWHWVTMANLAPLKSRK